MLNKLIKKIDDAFTRFNFGKPPEGPGPASLEEAELVGLHGDPLPTDAYKGKVVLFVNVASRCRLTPQYETLVEIRKRFQDQGFEVIGAPCNQFLGQEPGTAENIQFFCTATYGVDFPLLEKQEVNGRGRSPLYQFLIKSEAGAGENINWNFEKFLVDREGVVRFRFAPPIKPDAPEVIAAIESLL